MSNKSDAELDVRIGSAIQDKDKISVKSSKINQRLEHYILKIITGILKKHGQERFIDMVYTILKELAINAVKANQKRIFFEESRMLFLRPEYRTQFGCLNFPPWKNWIQVLE
jgi:hypothetical protein